MYARWIAYIQTFTFFLKHKWGQLNKVADALSRQVVFFTSIKSEIIGFEYLRDLNADNEDFKHKWKNCTLGTSSKYQIYDGFLFLEDCLRIPQGSLRAHIIRELYSND